jgi:hypothetical protein
MPDGSGFAFSVGTEERSDVFTARPDGSGAAQLTIDASTHHADAAYSPDGAQLAFDEDAPDGEAPREVGRHLHHQPGRRQHEGLDPGQGRPCQPVPAVVGAGRATPPM